MLLLYTTIWKRARLVSFAQRENWYVRWFHVIRFSREYIFINFMLITGLLLLITEQKSKKKEETKKFWEAVHASTSGNLHLECVCPWRESELFLYHTHTHTPPPLSLLSLRGFLFFIRSRGSWGDWLTHLPRSVCVCVYAMREYPVTKECRFLSNGTD